VFSLPLDVEAAYYLPSHDLHTQLIRFEQELPLTPRFLLLTVGLLIGPRGNTLKKMETESGAKIAIRGKGSVKEGKGRSDAAHTSNQEEDLHCLIMADTEDKVNKAKELIHQVIETVSATFYMMNTLVLILPSRLRQFPKVRTSSSAISSASLLLSTVHSVMTRTKRARTVSHPQSSSRNTCNAKS
jgi:hypothetical protein